MKRKSTILTAGWIVIWAAWGGASPAPSAKSKDSADIVGGELRVTDPDLLDIQRFPLEHTDVKAEIVGNVARVEVTQSFGNPYDKKIEAVYVFPLPSRAAVDHMEIRVGERTIKAVLKKRDEARRIYEQARQSGHVAALLDQERPNIFTQSVANILPGNRVDVKIRYFELLPYVDNDYAYSFPMVVGPRFIPGSPTSDRPRGWSPDTTDVPDASRITPPVLKPGQRSGHDISLEVKLDAGTEIVNLVSPTHDVDVEQTDDRRAHIVLKQQDSIPNKDFVLRYRVDGTAPQLVFLPHRKDNDGYFLMLIQPEARPEPEKIAPKEMVFVVDCSGSMSGRPIEKVKEAMRYSLENLNPDDTFQIVRFSNRAETFAPSPVPATEANIQKALAYVGGLSGSGGTIMLDGVRAALAPSYDPARLRIVSFMTDGYIGNEAQILTYLENNLKGARLFSFGVGSSVNRYLLDKMAEFGRGAVEYVLLQDDAEAPVKRFYERIRNPYLTDIEIDWGGAMVQDVYPRRIPDLFLGQPVVLTGRYSQPGTATLTLKARMGGSPYQQRIEFRFPTRHEEGEAIGTLWARARIEELSNQQIVDPQPGLEDEITQVALAHRLVSVYTSFVAVEEKIVTGSDQPVLVEVPVEMPEGVSYEGVFGGEAKAPNPVGLKASTVSGGMASGIVGTPALVEESTDAFRRPGRRAPAPMKSEPPPLESDPTAIQSAGLVCRIDTAKPSYRVGEPIEIVVSLQNLTGQTVQVPAALSVIDGSVRFQILDSNWKMIPHPTTQTTKPRIVELPPAARVELRLVLNETRGYPIAAPGTYHIVLLGSELSLPDSNVLTLRIDP